MPRCSMGLKRRVRGKGTLTEETERDVKKRRERKRTRKRKIERVWREEINQGVKTRPKRKGHSKMPLSRHYYSVRV